MKKRLVASTTADTLLAQFKDIVSLDDIARMLHGLYMSWSSAQQEGLIDEQYDSWSQWFDDYYDAITSDCIRQANENVLWHDLYADLLVEEQESLESKIKDYIKESKEQLQEIMSVSGEVS